MDRPYSFQRCATVVIGQVGITTITGWLTDRSQSRPRVGSKAIAIFGGSDRLERSERQPGQSASRNFPVTAALVRQLPVCI